MAVAEKQLTPEEKLLKVIQGGGEEKKPSPEEKLLATVKPPAASAATTPVAPAEPAKKAPEVIAAPPPKKPDAAKEEKKPAEAKAAPADAEEKPKLKVLKPEAATEAKEAPAKSVIGAAGSGVIGTGGLAVVSGRKAEGRKFTIATVNQGLAAVVLLIIMLTGFEVKQTATELAVEQSKIASVQPRVVAETPAGADELPPLPDVLSPWDDKNPFLDTQKPPKGPGVVQTQASTLDLSKLKLMGFSDDKAILKEAKDENGQMFIVGKGEKILVGDVPLELLQVEKDRVVLSDGVNSGTLK